MLSWQYPVSQIRWESFTVYFIVKFAGLQYELSRNHLPSVIYSHWEGCTLPSPFENSNCSNNCLVNLTISSAYHVFTRNAAFYVLKSVNLVSLDHYWLWWRWWKQSSCSEWAIIWESLLISLVLTMVNIWFTKRQENDGERQKSFTNLHCK